MAKSIFSKIWLVVLIVGVAALAAACSVQVTQPTVEAPQDAGGEVAPAPPATDGGEVVTLYVGPNRVPCVGVAPQACMQVSDSPDGEYQLFYGNIDGFDYEPGFMYELSVQKTDVPNPPADASSIRWTLVEVVSKTPVESTLTLEGTPWELIASLDGNGVMTMPVPNAAPSMVLEDGGVTGSTGCNNFFGSYTVDADQLTFTPMGATMMACPDPLSAQEQNFLAGLGSTASYVIVGNQLHLFDAAGELIQAFEPQKQVTLEGALWSATGYNNGKGGVQSLAIGSEITAVFADGTVGGTAGCNNYSAGYKIDGNNISVGPAISTQMFCADPEGIMDQEQAYLAALQNASVYSINKDRLELRDADGALQASYIAAGVAPVTDVKDDEATGYVDAATMEALSNMTYTNVAVTDTVTLVNGVYTSTVADGATYMVVELTDITAVGELDGQPSVAVILVSNGGGSGIFSDLAVVQDQDDQPVNVATTMLGDRVSINSLEIVDNQIVVDMITQGPDEPMCCGTHNVINIYELVDGELVLVSSEDLGSVSASAPDSIVGVLWEWQGSVYGNDTEVTPDAPGSYTLVLNEDGTASAQIDCNNGGGSYTLDGSSLTVEILTMTRRACPDETLSEEYVRDLNGAASYVMDGNDLIINMMADAGNMRFSPSADQPVEAVAAPEVAPEGAVTPEITQPASAADILAVTWQWVGITDPVNGETVIDEAAKYTLLLQPSGIARVQADCNRGAGSYSIDGGSISIDISTLTRAFCGEDSLDGSYIQALNSAATWFVDGENLYIDLFADSGTMKFAKGS